MSEPIETIAEPRSVKKSGTALAPPPLPRKIIVRPTPRHAPAEAEELDASEKSQIAAGVAVYVVLGLAVAGFLVWFFLFRTPSVPEPIRKAPQPRIITIQLPPPPPPPPKIKPPEPPKADKRPEAAPEAKLEPKPEAPKPAEKPPEGLGTNIKGNGAGIAGLGSSGNGVIGGTGSGRGGGGGSVGRWYAGRVSARVAEALRSHPKTRAANFRAEVFVWVDPTGRIERATVSKSSGDPALDQALITEIIPGTRLAEAPPTGLRMPIPLPMSARRPN